MFQLHSWPNAILHLDGDAFFAAVFQATNPSFRGKPVVTGSERGLATAVSYEARKFGIKRGMLTWQIKKICPQCIILPSDYELYGLFSKKMFDIVRSFTPLVEEYSIDEAFADVKGLRQPLHLTYREIGQKIKNKIESSLGITVSVGISATKSLAKLASSSRKPSGLTIVPGPAVEQLLRNIPVCDVWGIGEQTSAYLSKFGIKTAFDFAKQHEDFVRERLSKPYFEIWQELRGTKVYELDIGGKESYKGITRSQTFSPSSNDKDLLWAKLQTHLEHAFAQARKFRYVVGRITLFLKTQKFEYHAKELKLSEKVAYPYLIRKTLKSVFEKIYRNGSAYRATGCHITDFQENTAYQLDLFNHDTRKEEKIKKIYPLYEAKKVDFGSMLFDKQHISNFKKKPKLELPVIALR